jgi:uncharacterized protein YkwD
VFAPVGEPAGRYNDGGPAPPGSAIVERVAATVARVAAHAGRAAPPLDGRLCAVAAEMAGLLGDGPPPYGAIEFSLSYHGIVEPAPYLVLVRMQDGDLDGLAAELEAKLPAVVAPTAFARLGAGVASGGDGSSSVVVALQESGVATEPIPRSLPRGGALRLRGRLLTPDSTPEVFVTGVDGEVTRLPVVHDGGAGFRAEASCGDVDGRLKVEIVAADRAQNPSVLANFAVWCGEAPPRSLELAASAAAPAPATADGKAPADTQAVEREIFELANRDRARAGLPPLVWDDRAADIARKHSVEMRDLEYVAHVSPRTGSASDRARAGGLATPLLLENLARAYSPSDVEEGLMGSPGHRANLLSKQATHLGVGAAIGRPVGGQRELYVTQLFFRKTPLVERAAARRIAADALARARRDAGRATLDEDAALDEVAERHAALLAAGRSHAAAGALTDHALDLMADRFGQVISIVAVTGDPADSVRDNVLDRGLRAFGLGVAQGPHPDLGDGAFYVVILLAKGR